MRFHAPQDRFELGLVGQPDRGPYRWCTVRVVVDGPGGAWSAESRCLLAEELAELADWLDQAAGNRTLAGKFKACTLDNMINFELTGSGPRHLRVYLEWELRPLKQRELPVEGFYRDYPVTVDDLQRAAASLREELSRATRGRRGRMT